MSFSLNSTISEYTADQASFENENLTPFEALRRVRMMELERLQKMNSEKGNEENGNKINTTKADILADRMKLLLSTAKFADAHFLVGQNDKKQLVLAHRAILSASSDVFEAMFQKEATENANGKICGKTSAEKDHSLLVPDVDAEAFKVMLRFIYLDDLSELNGKNAAEVLYAALKFNVIGLVKALADFPIPKLSHVFAALSFARFNELLKDFVQQCFEYIDKNTYDLFKSEEFLQIDQNLLCEIFERDQLQICGEIPIWKAALRWSDTKCRQNGIECSALNRRAMLGPALFKIRFPLLSNEAFSKTIVPSDVLSKDEVIAVYQFHTLPNRRGIFNGFFPMPFPTNGRISDQKKGTLLMDIEKVSEFAREEIKSSRFSEKMYINGLPWKIYAENDKDENNDNKLYIFLLCDAPEKDKNWNCKCSGNVRIVSQKNEVLGFKKVFVDLVFDNEHSWQCVVIISFAELMDPSKGLYDKKEDKVTLAIDVILKDEKTEEFVSDPNKSNGTISMEIEKASEFVREVIGSERNSETVHINKFPWKICAKNDKDVNNDNKLYIFLFCDAPEKDKNWNCKCSGNVRIVSQKNEVLGFKKVFVDLVFDNEHSWQCVVIISFAELMDSSKGFYNQEEDKVTLAIDVTVKEAKMEETTHKYPICEKSHHWLILLWTCLFLACFLLFMFWVLKY